MAGILAFSQDFDSQFNDGVSVWGMEAASVLLPATTTSSSYVSVSFRRTYSTPPVVTVMSTTETADPAAIRIRNVTTTGFEALQVEPANQDGTQGAMTLHYVAVEPGTHELPDGTRVLADTVSTNVVVHGSGVAGAEGTISVNYPQWPGSSGGGSISPLPDSQVFAYDANGNRSSLTEDAVLYAYSSLANSNQLLSTTGPQPRTYSYDLAGNVTGDGVHSYGYDDRGRLIDVDAGAATYTYNGQGQRVSKTSGTTTLFAYGEVGELLGEYDASGTALQETVWFNGAPVALRDGTSTYYVHSDHIGTPRVISDGNTAIWRWESDPFGSTLPDEDPDNDGTTLTYNLRFPGQYYDAETGLHYNYFRTYDPSTGRYLESDPIGLDGGLNTYSYVEGNPLLRTDPFGLDPSARSGEFFRCLFQPDSPRCAGRFLEETVADMPKELIDDLGDRADKVTDKAVQCAQCVWTVVVGDDAESMLLNAANSVARRKTKFLLEQSGKKAAKKVIPILNAFDTGIDIYLVLLCASK